MAIPIVYRLKASSVNHSGRAVNVASLRRVTLKNLVLSGDVALQVAYSVGSLIVSGTSHNPIPSEDPVVICVPAIVLLAGYWMMTTLARVPSRLRRVFPLALVVMMGLR